MTPTQRAAAERLIATKTRIVGQLWAAEAVALLRELLEATDAENATVEPVQEPVAWGVFVDDELFKPFNCKDEAVDWFQAPYNRGSRYDYLVLPLFAAPQQRRPLSADQIRDAVNDHAFWATSKNFIFRIARAIERAHGITGEPT